MIQPKLMLLSSALLLSACAQGALHYRPTMGADPSEIGYEAQALINEMRLAYVEQSGCAAVVPSVQNTEKESYRRIKGSGGFSCVRFAAEGEAKITPQRYYEAGTALSDIYCDDYFRRIAEHKQKRQFGRSTTNDVGTAASAGLGLASAGSILTGGIGAMFGLADNLFRNYDSAFVVEPNLGKMLKLIKTAQALHKSTVTPANLTSFFQAHRAVTDYAQQCSYVGMDALLDRAIETGTTSMTISDTITAFQNSSETIALKLQEHRTLTAERNLDLVRRERAANAGLAAKAGGEPANPAPNPDPRN